MNETNHSTQLSRLLKSSQPQYILNEVKRIFLFSYSSHLFSSVMGNFKHIVSLFTGKFPGYQKCNTEYHNLGHTLDALLAAARLIDGYNISGSKMDENLAVNLLLAALFHDTGYIQESWDMEGTGAKYTKIHVERSMTFIQKNNARLGLSLNDAEIISKIISCTGLQVNWKEISFKNHEEEVAGAILGTADLLGQMADRLYLEKLLFLYYEFREAGIQGYDTEYDIIKKTVGFYEITMDKFKENLMNVYEYAQAHFKERFGIDRNLYIDSIQKHIAYLNKIIEDHTTNFRKKLKRKSEYILSSAEAH